MDTLTEREDTVVEQECNKCDLVDTKSESSDSESESSIDDIDEYLKIAFNKVNLQFDLVEEERLYRLHRIWNRKRNFDEPTHLWNDSFIDRVAQFIIQKTTNIFLTHPDDWNRLSREFKVHFIYEQFYENTDA